MLSQTELHMLLPSIFPPTPLEGSLSFSNPLISAFKEAFQGHPDRHHNKTKWLSWRFTLFVGNGLGPFAVDAGLAMYSCTLVQ